MSRLSHFSWFEHAGIITEVQFPEGSRSTFILSPEIQQRDACVSAWRHWHTSSTFFVTTTTTTRTGFVLYALRHWHTPSTSYCNNSVTFIIV